MSKETRILGGLGAIFMVLGVVPSFSLLSIVGFILLLVAYNKASKELDEEMIFKKALSSFLISFIGLSVTVIILAIFFFRVFFNLFFNLENLNELDSVFEYLGNNGFAIFYIVILLIILYILLIISSYKLKEAENLLASETNQNLFNVSGMLNFIGAILTLFFVGGILILISHIVRAIAFFTTEEKVIEQKE